MKVETVTRHWDQIRRGLIETIDKFSDQDLDYAAYEGGFSVRQLLLHIAQEEYGEIQYGLTCEIDAFPPDYPQALYPTVESTKRLLAEVHAETLEYLKGLKGQDLDAEIEPQWGGTHPLIDLIWHVMEHEIHHRGELSLILGLLGREGLDA